ncbi:YsnF/AvaK domain-containing protein [Priestia megaterium]|uniref:YsnF/AvaK domain-containing protein n=1 Tax=Priestia megaterium TaxID=1404 RepID=UPI0015A9C3E8|nr:YsnF/AvaK domain-containing protein [Priestia megaterium]QLC90745.1 YsnF/AvaK domain-containing protein [Priestia megaterium]
MTKNVIGTYDNEEAIVTAIQNLKIQGFQEEDLSLVTSKDIDKEDYSEVESKEGIDVKKIETTEQNHQDESIMDKIKHMFSPDYHKEPHKDKARVEKRLINLGVPLTEAGSYADDLQKGKVLLLVRANRETKTNSFLEKREDSPFAKGDSVYDKSLYGEHREHEQNVPKSAEEHIELKEEQLHVDKERVQAGEVQVDKEVLQKEETVNIPVEHEEVYVERRPVSDKRTNAQIREDDETVRIPLEEEKVTVSKEPVVTEEVIVGKRRKEKNEKVSETLKKEEVNIKNQETSLTSNHEKLNK